MRRAGCGLVRVRREEWGRAFERGRACAASSSAPCAPTATASACVRCSLSCRNASSAAASAAVRAAFASCNDPCRLPSSCSAAW